MKIDENKNFYNIIILVGAILLIVTRHVDFIIYPRFWAEEGSVYFLDAYTFGASSLWHAHQGYYSIIPNFSTYFATFVPLEFAPIITTLIAFVVQVVPFYLINISKSEFFNTSFKKLLASMIILFVGNTEQIWLNTITSQFHFVVILFLLLIDNKSNLNKGKSYIFYIITLISGLSGVPANILAPIFFYNYFITKQKINLHMFGILVITSLIQVIAISTSTSDVTNRTDYPGFSVIGHILISIFQAPIFHTTSGSAYTLLILPLIYIIIKSISPKKYFLIFFGSTFLLASIMILTSMSMAGGWRYIYAPGVIFMFGLLSAVFDTSISKRARVALRAYIAIAIFYGVINFPLLDEGTYPVHSKHWKHWKDEALLYKEHSIDEIAIYPQWEIGPWSVSLPRKEQ